MEDWLWFPSGPKLCFVWFSNSRDIISVFSRPFNRSMLQTNLSILFRVISYLFSCRDQAQLDSDCTHLSRKQDCSIGLRSMPLSPLNWKPQKKTSDEFSKQEPKTATWSLIFGNRWHRSRDKIFFAKNLMNKDYNCFCWHVKNTDLPHNFALQLNVI